MTKKGSYKLLIVGAGGIGIEIIKLLSLHSKILENMKLKKITIVDNDTIELSNLNRQFIFMKKDLGKYKSEVAKNFLKKYFVISIESLIQKVQYEDESKEAGLGNRRFDINFFKEYDFIFNCLDNLETRQFISRRVFLCNKIFREKEPITIIDGGTSGFQGQVRVFINTSCYDCLNIQNNTEVVPICTIKGKPDKFEHCLVWAINKVEDLKTDLLENKSINFNDLSIYKPIKKAETGFLINLENEIYEIFKTTNKTNILECLNDKNFKNKLIYFLSVKRCMEFNIKNRLTFMQMENKMDQIIPSLSTINAIISSLMLKNFLLAVPNEHIKDYFVTGAKILSAEVTKQNHNCSFCKNKLLLVSKSHCNVTEVVEKRVKLSEKKFEIQTEEIMEIKEFLNLKEFSLSNLEDLSFSIDIKKSFKSKLFLFSNQIYLIQEGSVSYLLFIIKGEEFNLQLF